LKEGTKGGKDHRGHMCQVLREEGQFGPPGSRKKKQTSKDGNNPVIANGGSSPRAG